GLRKPVAGSITLDDTELVGRGVADVLAAGVGYVLEDRSTDGIVGTFSVEGNLVLDLFDRVPYSRCGALNKGAIRDNAEQTVVEFDVRTQNVQVPAGTLSGEIGREACRDGV